jgi:hypothetical protein
VIRKGSKNAPAKKKEAKDLASVLERELAYEKEVRGGTRGGSGGGRRWSSGGRCRRRQRDPRVLPCRSPPSVQAPPILLLCSLCTQDTTSEATLKDIAASMGDFTLTDTPGCVYVLPAGRRWCRRHAGCVLAAHAPCFLCICAPPTNLPSLSPTLPRCCARRCSQARFSLTRTLGGTGQEVRLDIDCSPVPDDEADMEMPGAFCGRGEGGGAVGAVVLSG